MISNTDTFDLEDLVVKSTVMQQRLAKIGVHLPFRPDEILFLQELFNKIYEDE